MSLNKELTVKSSDYLKYISMEAIEKAASGHPGLPLGCSEIGIMLYRYVLKHTPARPDWPDRDRFVLSAGHGSMLLYSLLYMSGYDFDLNDLNKFRQFNSKTPGHPEYEPELGIETTTGPLGQGFANAVGLAIEEKILEAKFNSEGQKIFDYSVYTLMGDGCIMEGVVYEAASVAGSLGLNNLTAIYDSNNITIDGKADLTLNEDIEKRFASMGWEVVKSDSSDPKDLYSKLKPKAEQKKPRLIIVKTIIGRGLDKKADTSSIHGSPAGIDEMAYFVKNSSLINLFNEKYNKDLSEDELKEIIKKRIADKEELLFSEEAVNFMRERNEENQSLCREWESKVSSLPEDLRNKLNNFMNPELSGSLRKELLSYSEEKADATRNICGRVLNLCSNKTDNIIGGTADLSASTKAKINSSGFMSKDNYTERNIAFGIREHAMGSIANGMALSGSIIPFTSTFMTFFDYMKPPVRLSALMKLKHLFIFSHDSLYVGEDGPTHQPVEHLNSMRLIPDFLTFRPANDFETAFSFLYFLYNGNGPSAIITSRQKIDLKIKTKNITDREELFRDFCNGAYIFYETSHDTDPDLILAASGSEMELAVNSALKLEEQGTKVRIVSIPCMDLLSTGKKEVRDKLFLNSRNIPTIFIEASSAKGVDVFTPSHVRYININTFGTSAPAAEVAEFFKFNCDNVINTYRQLKQSQTEA